jgi:6-phosphogluconolactonase
MSEWHEFPSRAELDTQLAAHLAAALSADIKTRGCASLALSGGSTPVGMFRALSRAPLDWSRVDVTLVDERWVAPDHADSNERLLRENLLQNEASGARLTSLKTAHPHPAEAVPEVEARIATIALPFSALVLGMGDDGHTASWFPRAVNLCDLTAPEGGARVGATEPVTAAHPRMTFTLPAVLDSREIIIHVTGREKRDILESACERGYPIATILKQTKTTTNIWWAP